MFYHRRRVHYRRSPWYWATGAWIIELAVYLLIAYGILVWALVRLIFRATEELVAYVQSRDW